MENKSEKFNIKLPESTLQIIKEAQESYNRFTKNISDIIPKIPKIDIPKIQLPELKNFDNIKFPLDPDITREQNAWERHKQILDVENAVLGVQTEILKEQKSTTKLTKLILFLTILGIIITLVIFLFNLKIK